MNRGKPSQNFEELHTHVPANIKTAILEIAEYRGITAAEVAREGLIREFGPPEVDRVPEETKMQLRDLHNLTLLQAATIRHLENKANGTARRNTEA